MENIEPKTKWLIITTSIAALYLDSFLHGAVVPIVAEWEWSSTEVVLNSTNGGDVETRSSFVIDAIFLSTGIMEIVLSPLAGIVADRRGFDAVIIAGLLVGIIKCLLFGCFGTSVWIVSINRILQGVMSACTGTIGIARITDFYAEASPECANVMAAAMCKVSINFFSGLLIGELYGYLKHRVFLLVLPVSLLIIVGVLMTFRTENFHSKDKKKGEGEEVSSPTVGWRVICDVQLLILSICFLIANLGGSSFEPSVAVWMKSTFGAGPDTMGVVLGLCGVAVVTGSVAAAQILSALKHPSWILSLVFLCLTGLPLLCVNFSRSIFAAGTLLCTYNLFVSATRFTLLSMCETLAAKRYPTAKGLTFAVLNVGWAASYLLGPLLASYLFGSTCIICIIGAACVVVSSSSIFLRQLEAKRGPNLMDCCPRVGSGYMALTDEKVPFTYDISKETLQPQNQ